MGWTYPCARVEGVMVFVNVCPIENKPFRTVMQDDSIGLYDSRISRIQTAMRTVWRVGSGNVTCCVRVYLAHETCFVVPIFSGILDDTQTIYPQVGKAEAPCNTNGVSEGWR
jgi:hypothetical protein